MGLENALEAKKLELQTLPGLADENAKLRLETSRKQNSARVLSQKGKTGLLFCGDVRDMEMVAQKVQTQTEANKKWNTELESKIQELKARPFVDPAGEQALVGIAISSMPKLAASRVERANSRWDAQNVVESTETAETDVTTALEAISSEITSPTDRKVAIVESELVDALKQLSTNIEMESQEAISCVRAELERDDGDALRSVAASRAVLKSSFIEVCRDLPKSRGCTAVSGGEAATPASGAIDEPMAVPDAEMGDAPGS